MVTDGRWTIILLFGLVFEKALGATEVAINGIPQSILAVLNPTMLLVRTVVPDAMNNGPVNVMTLVGTIDLAGSKGMIDGAVLHDKCLKLI